MLPIIVIVITIVICAIEYHTKGKWDAIVLAGGLFIAVLTAFFPDAINLSEKQAPISPSSVPTGEGAYFVPVYPAPTSQEPAYLGNSEPSSLTVPESRYLSELDRVNKGRDMSIDKTIDLGGTPYPHSFQYTYQNFATDTVGYVEYNLGSAYTSFTATVGVNDTAKEADQTGSFTVFLDGSPVGTWTASFGKPVTIEVSVTGALRLRLECSRSGTVGVSPAGIVQAGANAAFGISNGKPDLIWGSPVVHK